MSASKFSSSCYNAKVSFSGLAATPVEESEDCVSFPVLSTGHTDSLILFRVDTQHLDASGRDHITESCSCGVGSIMMFPLDHHSNQSIRIWIHGGGFTLGGASMPDYHGAELARSQNIVVVTFKSVPFSPCSITSTENSQLVRITLPASRKYLRK